MNFKTLRRKIKRAMPTILTFIGAGGVIGVAYAASKAGEKKAELEKQAKEERLTKSEAFFLIAPAYGPTIGIAAGTMACIFGANKLNKKQQASLISAYAILERSYSEYRKTASDLLGNDGDKEIVKEMVKSKLSGNLSSADKEDGEKQLFYDMASERYFQATKETVMAAEYMLNRNMAIRGYAPLNEFYGFLGIPKVSFGEEIGWSLGTGLDFYGYQWIDFTHEETEVDGVEVTIIRMPFEPHLDYLDE